MRIVFILFAWLCPIISIAQGVSAKFPGGDKAQHDFIVNNLKYPEKAPNVYGDTVFKVFLNVDTFGKAEVDFIIGSNDDLGFKESIRRLVAKMPEWHPATNGREAQNSQVMMEVKFSRTLSSQPVKVKDTLSLTNTTRKLSSYEVRPTFKGGNSLLKKRLISYFRDSLHISTADASVYVKSIIHSDGRISSIAVLDKKGNIASEHWVEALYAAGLWNPGGFVNQPINVQYLFRLNLKY